MQTLEIDPAVPFLLGPGEMTVVLVGCGGTGSHIAQSLARIASHLSGTHKAPHLIFVDGDTVELKNVGRQLFSHADIGGNKATVLAERFNRVFGLDIGALPAMATKTNLHRIVQQGSSHGTMIVVGAVDTAAARRVLVEHTKNRSVGWLDCGNHEHSGQVCFGTATSVDDLHGAIQLNICAALPAPHLVHPDMLTHAPTRRRADCAAAVEDNIQGLMVNQMMAAIAAQYLYQLIVHRRLTTFTTTMDLGALSMRSTPITARQVAAAINVSPEFLTRTTVAKARRAA